VLDEHIQQRILEARAAFRRDLPEELTGQIEFFDAERYNAAASLQDNILFGKIAYGEADGPVRVPAVLSEVLDTLSLRATVIDVGLDYQVGSGGSRLSLAQRQRAAIARALLKRPDLLILNEATAALDGQAQGKVTQGLQEEMAGRGLIWVLHRASLARNFDRVLVMSGGKLQEQGRVADLAFSPDDRQLASSSEDTTILIWDMNQPLQPGKFADRLGADKLKAHWRTLFELDAKKADTAIWSLVKASADSLPYLHKHFVPAARRWWRARRATPTCSCPASPLPRASSACRTSAT
jgi:ABC-type multidrug transport system ATPase subunit